MKRITIEFTRKPHARAKLAQLGTVVYVLHPDDPTNVLTIPHQDEGAASATFGKIRREYFGTHIGWSVFFESDTVEPATWVRPKPTAEEQAKASEALEIHRRGWATDGPTMALAVYRDPDVLAAALENARDVTALHVLIGLEDNVDKIRRPTVISRLAKGAAPNLVELTFESPWVPRGALAKLPLKLPGRLIEQKGLERIAAVGVGAWPTGATPKRLTHVRLLSTFAPDDMKQIASVPGLEVLQIAINTKVEVAARAAFPLVRLQELTLEWLGDVAAMMNALLDGHVPALVQLQGAVKSGPELRAAIARWKREAPESTLRFGDWPMDHLDAPAREMVAEAGIAQYVSPFEGSQRTPEQHALWAPFKRIYV